MKFIKSFFTPETLQVWAIIVTSLLPKTIIPFALIFIGGAYLSYAAITHITFKIGFGPVLGSILILTFGICSFVTQDRIMVIAAPIVITLVIGVIWLAWKSKSESP